VTTDPVPLGVSVGITNTRLNAAKRGIAVELALRLVAAANTPVCVVGADPTDRDVERRMPELLDGYEHTLRQISDGTRSLEATFVPARRLCIVSVPDRAGVEAVLPELRSTFRCVVIDAPSRVGSGVGIARVLVEHLNVLLVASELTAGELVDARNYVNQFAAIPRAKHLAIRVVTSGHPEDSRMSGAQLDRRPGESGHHTIDEVHRGTSGAVIEQRVAVEDCDRRGVEGSEERGPRVRGTESRVDPSVESEHEYRRLEVGSLDELVEAHDDPFTAGARPLRGPARRE